jgi:hypothetical protein
VTLLQHLGVRTAWLGLGAVLVLVLVFRGGSSDFAAAWAGAQQELRVTAAWLKRVQAVRDSAMRERGKARALAKDTAQLRAILDTANRRLADAVQQGGGALATVPVLIARTKAACQSLVDNCEQRAQFWQAADFHDSMTAADALKRLKSSDSTVAALGGVGECHLIHLGPIKAFGCPSRLGAFKVGLVGGVVLLEGARLVLSGKP